jgi:uncharacterized protein YbaR (Trm112 family)
MTRYLMDFCYYYKKGVCNETVRRARSMGGPLEPGESFPMFPSGQEQEKLDMICESCPHGFFKIDNPEYPGCPVCRQDLWNIDKSKIEEGTLNDVAVSTLVYHFKCPQCRRNLYNDINLWA